MVEDHIGLVLDEYISNFLTHEVERCLYISKDLSEVFLRSLQSEIEGVNKMVDNEHDNISMKSKMIVKPGIIAIRFDEKSIFCNILGFNPQRDYENYNEYKSRKITNLSTIDEIHLKYVVIDGCVVCGLRQPILLSFHLDKPPRLKVFREPETIHHKKNKQICFEYYIFLFRR